MKMEMVENNLKDQHMHVDLLAFIMVLLSLIKAVSFLNYITIKMKLNFNF